MTVPDPGSRLPGRDAEDLVRLTNRVALLTFVAAGATIAALTSLPTLLSPSTRLVARLAATAVVALALFAFLAVRRARVRLGAARDAAAHPTRREAAP